jgi:hypothetical protein
MVLFDGQSQDGAQTEQGLLALVEFKKGWIAVGDNLANDHDKLLRILPHIDTCQYGIVCGTISDEPDWFKAEAERVGDHWFERAVTPQAGEAKRHTFYARLFTSPPNCIS